MDGLSLNNKEYIINVYRPGANGAFVGTISEFKWSAFRKQVNAGIGDLTFSIPKKFDDFGQGDLIAHNNQIKMFCVDKDSGPNGVLVYSGWIYAFKTSIKGNAESVSVSCYGNGSKLTQSLLREGNRVILPTSVSGLTISGSGAAVAVEVAFRAVVDRYRSNANSPIANYNAESLEATGKTMAYVFDKQFVAPALSVCVGFAPPNWFWYCDQSNVISLSAKPTTATHTFVFGKHFHSVDILNNSDSVINNVIFSSNSENGNILKRYKDDTSIGKYDDRWAIVSDNRVSLPATADNFGNSYLAENKDPFKRTEVVIIDNNLSNDLGYDIETIQPGDTCRFLGFNDITSQNFSDNMLIVMVEYSEDSVKLTLEQLPDTSSKQILETEKLAEQAIPSNNIHDFT